MPHARKQIRDRAVAELTGLASTGDSVFPGRVRPLAANAPASLFVYSLEEDVTLSATASMGAPRMDRALALMVEGRVSLGGDTDPEDNLDQIALEVEQRLGPSTLGGMLLELTLENTKLQIMAEGESLLGSIALHYRAVYRTAEGAPDTLL